MYLQAAWGPPKLIPMRFLLLMPFHELLELTHEATVLILLDYGSFKATIVHLHALDEHLLDGLFVRPFRQLALRVESFQRPFLLFGPLVDLFEAPFASTDRL